VSDLTEDSIDTAIKYIREFKEDAEQALKVELSFPTYYIPVWLYRSMDMKGEIDRMLSTNSKVILF